MTREQIIEVITKAYWDSDPDVDTLGEFALTALEQAGMVVVPAEATPKMQAAGIDADDKRTGGQTCAYIYAAMIRAAQEG